MVPLVGAPTFIHLRMAWSYNSRLRGQSSSNMYAQVFVVSSPLLVAFLRPAVPCYHQFLSAPLHPQSPWGEVPDRAPPCLPRKPPDHRYLPSIRHWARPLHVLCLGDTETVYCQGKQVSVYVCMCVCMYDHLVPFKPFRHFGGWTSFSYYTLLTKK